MKVLPISNYQTQIQIQNNNKPNVNFCAYRIEGETEYVEKIAEHMNLTNLYENYKSNLGYFPKALQDLMKKIWITGKEFWDLKDIPLDKAKEHIMTLRVHDLKKELTSEIFNGLLHKETLMNDKLANAKELERLKELALREFSTAKDSFIAERTIACAKIESMFETTKK